MRTSVILSTWTAVALQVPISCGSSLAPRRYGRERRRILNPSCGLFQRLLHSLRTDDSHFRIFSSNKTGPSLDGAPSLSLGRLRKNPNRAIVGALYERPFFLESVE